MKEIPFIKMDGLGNDFFIIEPENSDIKLSPKEIQKLGDRKTGIGFDQLFILKPSKHADVQMVIYNSDGSKAGACGNGARCVADWFFKRNGVKECTIEAPGGKILKACAGRMITVNMGPALLNWDEIPLSRKVDTLFLPQLLPGFDAPCAVSMGNPHCVFFVKDIKKINLAQTGPDVESHPLFPERTNVEFAQIMSPSIIRMRVWERGAGITSACGSGACAVLVAAFMRGLTKKKAKIVMDGGTLVIEINKAEDVLMSGPVHTAFKGTAYL